MVAPLLISSNQAPLSQQLSAALSSLAQMVKNLQMAAQPEQAAIEKPVSGDFDTDSDLMEDTRIQKGLAVLEEPNGSNGSDLHSYGPSSRRSGVTSEP